MTAIIASGTTELASADFTVSAGVPTTVFLNTASGSIDAGCRASVQMKAVSGAYVPVGVLDRANPAYTIFGAGTFRVVRQVSPVAFAVDQN